MEHPPTSKEQEQILALPEQADQLHLASGPPAKEKQNKPKSKPKKRKAARLSRTSGLGRLGRITFPRKGNRSLQSS
jgi:hypothetical protein